MYLQGFGNYHQTEAIPGALPLNQNSPQQSHFGLYAEQLSGTAFTRARHNNLHSWFYRILPSVVQGLYHPYKQQLIQPFPEAQSPNPLRWSPLLLNKDKKCHFIDGLFHVAGNATVNTYLYSCNLSMEDVYFSNLDGELLFVPYTGEINLHTEFGLLNVSPGMIALIPRGVKFKLEVVGTETKGYLCENAGSPLALPQLGIIGANGLAHPRHFQYPVAAFETNKNQVTLLCKNQNRLWEAQSSHSPLNVVAWHGNYAPFRYDLSLFNTINTVSYDHPDPSIFTVLSSESTIPGTANLDFVIFPPRWMVAEHSFRLPYFHRNYMNELMGLICGEYDAKKEGFLPGGISIHNCMTPHGPDARSYNQAIQQNLKPELYENSLSFMFETKNVWLITKQAMDRPERQKEYHACWQNLVSAQLPG